ncbi:unnamed protein product [Fusarium graminearum]|uniref:Uncharacterized protein n=1 Tax=Gibberella zeae TaxID=5518 RepID=A0A4U9EY86_GIBZA|nr:unnamed protein product [Fusarium graminearum]CAG1966909.1 unnamed protein product [Fusarium graminearum]CAG1979416.1 unnamed protein product [Fusarium graminearum]VTO85682.1 unnamed protein product [Fusarium graminearum]
MSSVSDKKIKKIKSTDVAVLKIVIDTAARSEDVRLAVSIQARLFESNDPFANLSSLRRPYSLRS